MSRRNKFQTEEGQKKGKKKFQTMLCVPWHVVAPLES